MIENLDNILYTEPKICLERIFSIYLYNLQFQPISSQYYMKFKTYDFQNYVLLKAVRDQNPKIFLADEVGLGKTIEAFLIIQELILRENYKKILIILPKSLLNQWRDEILNWTYFSEQFPITYEVNGSNELLRCITSSDDKVFLLCSKGLLLYKDNFRKSTIDWDLIVIDEAHHARAQEYSNSERRNKLYQCLKLLGGKSKSILFLSATPIQLDSNEFKKLIEIKNEEIFHEISFNFYQGLHSFIKILYFLLDELEAEKSQMEKIILLEKINLLTNAPENIDYWDFVSKKYDFFKKDNFQDIKILYLNIRKIKKYLIKEHLFSKILIRNRKRDIFPNLKERIINDCPVKMHDSFKEIYQKIDDFINSIESDLENQASEGSYKYLIRGFLKSRFREFMVSSNAQIKKSLKIRLEKQKDNGSAGNIDEIYNIKNILNKLKILRIEDDRKLEKLKEILERFKSTKHIIIFANFYATLDFLSQFLQGYGKEIFILTGEHTPNLDDRKQLINDFEQKGGFLLSSNIGGEGLNLQFANIIINYDLNWNPTKLEQRIGRIDRIGQNNTVVVYNIYYEDSVAAKIHNVIRNRLNFQSQNFGEIDPIIEEISKQVGKNEISNKMFDPLNTSQFNEYKSLLDSQIRKSKKDLILEKESFNFNYYKELSRYFPFMDIRILMNYFNLLKENFPTLFLQKSDEYKNVFNFRDKYVYEINKDSPYWGEICRDENSIYCERLVGHINEQSKYFLLPKSQSPKYYSHGIGSPKINKIINFFGKKALLDKEVHFSSVASTSQKEGFLFLYQIEIESILLKQKLLIPFFFTSQGEYQELTGRNLLKEFLIDHLNSNKISDFNPNEEVLKDLAIMENFNKKKREIEEILLKEIDLIKNQRDFTILTKENHSINKKEKELNQVEKKISELEDKLKNQGYLAETDKVTLKGRITRKANLEIDIRFLENKKKFERRGISESSNFTTESNLICIFKVNKEDQEKIRFFNISNNFSDQKSKIYIGQEYFFKVKSLQDISNVFPNDDYLEFEIKLNNKTIIEQKILSKELIKETEHIIPFKISGTIPDFVNIELLCISNSKHLLLATEDINIELFSIFLKEKDEFIDISKNTDYVLKNSMDIKFLIKIPTDVSEIEFHSKNKFETYELKAKIPLKLVDSSDNLNHYSFDCLFNSFGVFNFSILGIHSNCNIINIPLLKIKFPKIEETQGFIITELENTFIIIEGEIDSLNQESLINYHLILKNHKKIELNHLNFNQIFKTSSFSNKENGVRFIKIPFNDFIPKEIKQNRIGRYHISIKMFDFDLSSFEFKLFPLIKYSLTNNLLLFDDTTLETIVCIKDYDHLNLHPYIKFKFPEVKYKFLGRKELIVCNCKENFDDNNLVRISIFSQIERLLPGEYYELQLETEYKDLFENVFSGPLIKLGNLGRNKIYIYNGFDSKILLFYNIGFKTISLNEYTKELDIGLNSFHINSEKGLKIKFDNNLEDVFEINDIEKELNFLNVLEEISPLEDEFSLKIKDFLLSYVKNGHREDNHHLIYLKKTNTNLTEFILNSKSYFDNIYIIYPTQDLFQFEISDIIGKVIENRNLEKIDLNLMVYPAPLSYLVYNETKEEEFQKRRVFPLCLEKCPICNRLLKFNEFSKNFECFCNDHFKYNQIPEIYKIDIRIVLNCPNCPGKLKILYSKSKKEVSFFCNDCDYTVNNINILFQNFKLSQFNSINFMTIEQLGYSISNNIIENKQINDLYQEFLEKFIKENIKITEFWKTHFPLELIKLDEEIQALNKIKMASKKKQIKINLEKETLPNNESKKLKNRIWEKIKSILTFLKLMFQRKTEKMDSNRRKNTVNNKKENGDLPFTSQDPKNFHRLKKVQSEYDILQKSWKNSINSFINSELLSKPFEKLENKEYRLEDLLDLDEIDEYDLFEEIEGSNQEELLRKYFILPDPVKFLENLKILDKYLNIREDFQLNITNFLNNDSYKVKNNLFLFLDLDNVEEIENSYIKNYSYVKTQLINFYNSFCSTNNNLGIIFY
ncbi:hypothetical protein LCGC14_0750900 [marine sediment metagenome]|uniref:Helicase n=1 Tax=marine sediment metagenome TaxID=412755 RepID=A0A0F9QNS6_9ZZZZ